MGRGHAGRGSVASGEKAGAVEKLTWAVLMLLLLTTSAGDDAACAPRAPVARGGLADAMALARVPMSTNVEWRATWE